ncbi:MAG: hypothetical protein MJY87_00555 [Fibrobacter sp.]|nr:hypothetical protein [Fibrobacter sp.]
MTGGIGFASLIFIILGALKVGSQHLGSQPDKKRTCPDCGSERLALQFEGFIDEKDNAQLKETPKKQWYDQ